MGCGGSKQQSEVKNASKVGILNRSYDLNGLKLQNRFVMGPMTRCRGDPQTGVPNDLMAQYYEQRAGFGLIITECSQISPLSNGYPGSGGIYNREQMLGWKKIVDRVHARGAKIIIQLWHCGRAVPSEFIGGAKPLAPSPIAISQDHQYTKKPHPVPEEMSQAQISEVLEQFKKSAELAKEAGFDGVQLHGANGYLIDQFMKDGTNQRTDKYGGSVENRCRFMLEAIDAVCQVYGSKKVSIRFSPTGRFGDMYDSDPESLMKYALGQLSKKDLHFVEVKRHASYEEGEASKDSPNKDQQGRTLPSKQISNFFKTLRGFYKGTFMANDGFNPKSAEEAINKNECDIVSFSTLSIMNPDLPERHRRGLEIVTTPDYSTFFAGGEKGYTDYPNYDDQAQNYDLNEEYDFNGLKLQNRFVMGPMTRCRGDPETGIPNDLMAEYYEQRAGFGLILTECSQISPLSNGYPGSGGMYNREQMEGWKKIVDRVHAKGAKIIIQLWHCGRAVPSEFIGGVKPLAPSPIAISQDHQYTKKPHPVPEEMSQEQINEVLEQFKKSAELAKEAGFDGVQLHGANGYLIDQFMRDGTNQRTDKYGGSVENRCRFMLEVVDTICQVFPSKKVSIRFSPTGRFGDMYDSDPKSLMKYALGQLSKKDLHFVEVKRHASHEEGEASKESPDKDQQGRTLPSKQIPDFYKTIRRYYKGTLMANDGFNPTTALQGIKNQEFDIVSYSTLSIMNPDLPQRHKKGQELNTTPDYSTFFAGGAKGYTDFPNFKDQQKS